MRAFAYTRATGRDEVVELLEDGARLLAGGMDLLDLMKEGIETPEVVVSLADLTDLRGVSWGEDGSALVGCRTTLAQISNDVLLEAAFPALTEACAKAATPQIRNRATLGGNLLQRPRCWYFRKAELGCLKTGGDGCPAVEGENRYHAILGGGPCWAVHASSPAVALMALDASLLIQGPDGTRVERVDGFFTPPTVDPTRENRLGDADLIVGVQLAKPPAGSSSAYYKVRHKEAWDWAMAEAAVRLTISGDRITAARVALGGVAPIPWRSSAAEAALVGKAPSEATFAAAADASVAAAAPLRDNSYKVDAARHVVEQALLQAAGGR